MRKLILLIDNEPEFNCEILKNRLKSVDIKAICVKSSYTDNDLIDLLKENYLFLDISKTRKYNHLNNAVINTKFSKKYNPDKSIFEQLSNKIDNLNIPHITNNVLIDGEGNIMCPPFYIFDNTFQVKSLGSFNDFTIFIYKEPLNSKIYWNFAYFNEYEGFSFSINSKNLIDIPKCKYTHYFENGMISFSPHLSYRKFYGTLANMVRHFASFIKHGIITVTCLCGNKGLGVKNIEFNLSPYSLSYGDAHLKYLNDLYSYGDMK